MFLWAFATALHATDVTAVYHSKITPANQNRVGRNFTQRRWLSCHAPCNNDCYFSGTTKEMKLQKPHILRPLQKTGSEGADVTCCGKPFQTRALVTGEARYSERPAMMMRQNVISDDGDDEINPLKGRDVTWLYTWPSRSNLHL